MTKTELLQIRVQFATPFRELSAPEQTMRQRVIEKYKKSATKNQKFKTLRGSRQDVFFVNVSVTYPEGMREGAIHGGLGLVGDWLFGFRIHEADVVKHDNDLSVEKVVK